MLRKPITTVPPGRGTAETHDRNIRRRRARQLKKLAAQGNLPDSAASETPTAPNIVNDAEQDTTSEARPDYPVPNMVNKNKKKGFMKEMLPQKGMKTIFAQGVEVASAPIPEAPAASSSVFGLSQEPDVIPRGPGLETTSGGKKNEDRINQQLHRKDTQRKWQKIIPPSELDDLPPNVFVTSMTFEAPRRDQRPRKPQNNGYDDVSMWDVAMDAAVHGPSGAEEQEDEPAADLAEAMRSETEPVPAVARVAEEVTPAIDPELVWAKVEVALEVLDNLTASALETLESDSVIAWRVSYASCPYWHGQLTISIGRRAQHGYIHARAASPSGQTPKYSTLRGEVVRSA